MGYRIDEHCNEDWEAMQPDERGRFCQRCQHSVIDATQMTKGEFESLFNEAKGELCVQFRANPMGDGVFRRDPVKPRPLGSFVLLSTLLASACGTEPPAEPAPLVAPGCQLVEDKTPPAAPESDAAIDAGVDAGDAAADVEAVAPAQIQPAPRPPIRRGRPRHFHPRENSPQAPELNEF
ncbi:MAG: hypothetical protein AB8H86_03695 [Polyangiales bacterium]